MNQPDELGGLDKKSGPSYLSDLVPLTMSTLDTIIYDFYEQSSAFPSKYISSDNVGKHPSPEETKVHIKDLILELANSCKQTGFPQFGVAINLAELREKVETL